ncbi:MAG: hypothetical protein KDB29_13320 [Planctomycetes bacterium]|nr:hypothetical protein [Planctomycetota bacterium]
MKRGTEFQLEEDEVQYKKSKLGTTQHRVLRGFRPTSVFDDGKSLRIRVKCLETPALAGAALDLEELAVPYGLAVTISTEADLPIYTEIASRLGVALPVRR